jgi:hypothetical protein
MIISVNSMLNAPFAMMLILLIFLMISPAGAQANPPADPQSDPPAEPPDLAPAEPPDLAPADPPAEPQVVSCTSSSPQCCSVKRIWEFMGKDAGVDSSNSTSCCHTLGSLTQSWGIPGVTCNSNGIVTSINWEDKGLSNSIPAEIGYLVNLEKL